MTKDYQQYVSLYEKHHEGETANSPQYRAAPRESDLVMLQKVAALLPKAPRPSALLDLCCSTGNFLHHLRGRQPELRLCGADLAAGIIGQNLNDPDLAGIAFQVSDIVTDNLAASLGSFSMVTINAALQFLSPGDLEAVVANIAAVLAPGGYFLNFDCYQPYNLELAIHTRTLLYPQGIKKYFHHTGVVTELLTANGFGDIVFEEFNINIDLPESAEAPGDISRTVTLADGRRLQFVGAIYQPWCFLTARKL
jgi:SAM-dependent methyltransferase